ncbi:MAG: serine/threonine-protein kinase [Candidatus Promineifilaceae bacterium]
MLEKLESGTILRERYRLNNIEGQGGMGNVYRAEDLRLPGRLCAIKEVQPEASAPPEVRKQEQGQFLREASLLAQLDHPNLPKVSDFFSDDGRDYLVMDYVAGKNLKELVDVSRIEGQQLDPAVVLKWADQIMDALEYLHNQDPPVLHRDIKPANIKLTPENRIKLVDFGLAKVLAGDDSRTVTVIQGRGTAFYTPLEQYGAESEHTDARSDIYALGATLYHLLAGQPPPEARSRFLNPAALPPLHKVNLRVSALLSEAIHWAMEMHPDDRPESIDRLRQAIKGANRRPAGRRGNPAVVSWGQALQANAAAVFLAGLLLLLAIVLTFT